MDEVPADAFLSDDALGWVYQFWQSAEKTRVNEEAKGGNRIPAKDIPAVTQLFTEPYMVAWLLDQSLTPTLNDLEKDLSQFTLLDPCCGSGHFLVAAFDRLTTARAERENLTLAEAGDKVLAESTEAGVKPKRPGFLTTSFIRLSMSAGT